jgi:hypothetical protein
MWRHHSLVVIVASLILFASQAGTQESMHRVAVLANMWFPELRQGWLEGLREHGYVEGGICRSSIVTFKVGPTASPRSFLS